MNGFQSLSGVRVSVWARVNEDGDKVFRVFFSSYTFLTSRGTKNDDLLCSTPAASFSQVFHIKLQKI